MRYFIIKNGADVIEKQAFTGNDETIDSLVSSYGKQHPQLTIAEVDKGTLDATPNAAPNSEQQAWLTAKTTSPQAAFLFLAKKLGLE